ncbi:MAG TPA: amino acid permease [Trichormus sp.]
MTSETDLNKLGYVQELFRTMGGFSNFAIGFSVVSVLTGAITLYDYGLKMGGPAEMTIGWPIVTAGTMFVVLSMAELASSLPTSGAQYHWSCELGGKTWGWFTAWFFIVGYVTALAGIDYGCAQFLMPMIGLPASRFNLLSLFGFLLVSHGFINAYGIRLVSRLNDISVAVHIIGIGTIIGALFIFAPKQPLPFLLQTMHTGKEQYSYWWAFILGLLQAQWTLSGYDSSASVSEETINARTVAPWGMVIAVVVSSIVGYIMLLALTLAITDVTAVLSAADKGGNSVPTVVAILTHALGDRAGAAVSVLAAMAMWFCGLGAVTGCSRGMYAFARDGGMPFSRKIKEVSKQHKTPVFAIWLTVACAFVVSIYSEAYAVVTAISVISLYFSYITPVYLSWRGRYVTPIVKGPWHLGKYSHTINFLAIAWTVFISIIVSIANDMIAGKTMLVLITVLALWYRFRERHVFTGPSWIGKGMAAPAEADSDHI